MLRPLDGAVGERLEMPECYADFAEHYERASEWRKLERGQVYAEPNSESWKAFDRGDWEESLRLMEKGRAKLIEDNRKDAERGMAGGRIRIVSLPPSEYLHWELYALKIRDESGEPVRILLEREVARLEDNGPLPDIVTIGTNVMYWIIYDGNGVSDHAFRYTDSALVKRCRDFIIGLYERGEPISEFFQREIAPLPPPRPARQAIPHDYLVRAGRPHQPHL